MDSGTLVALVVAFFALVGTIASPLLLSYLNARQAATKQIADYARQDLVATRAAQVAKQAAEAARLLVQRDAERDRRDEAVAANIDVKLDVIHTLVNSTLTGALEGHLLALQQLRTALRDGRPEAPDEIASAEGRIVEVQSQLADRARQGGSVS